MLNPQSIRLISLRMINGDIENFEGVSIEGVVNSFNPNGTWKELTLRLDNAKGWTERIIYTQHVLNVKIIYKETN